jgi:hypothetical protein
MSEAEQPKSNFNFKIPRMNHQDAGTSIMNLSTHVFFTKKAAWQDLRIVVTQLLEDAELQGYEKAMTELAKPEEDWNKGEPYGG